MRNKKGRNRKISAFEVLEAGVEPDLATFDKKGKGCTKEVKGGQYKSEVVDSKFSVNQGLSCSLDSVGPLSDKEKSIIDILRAQYKHNEIPNDLIEVIQIWQQMSLEGKAAIQALMGVYLQSQRES